MHALLPTLPQIRPPTVDLPDLRLALVNPRRFLQVLPRRLAVNVHEPRYLADAQPVMMQLLYLHEILQSQHPDPPSVRMPLFGLNWGIFKRRF